MCSSRVIIKHFFLFQEWDGVWGQSPHEMRKRVCDCAKRRAPLIIVLPNEFRYSQNRYCATKEVLQQIENAILAAVKQLNSVRELNPPHRQAESHQSTE